MSTSIDDIEDQIEQEELEVSKAKAEAPELVAVLAEFENVDDILNAARAVRNAGYLRWDVHTPFPVHGMDSAIGIKPTVLPWIVLAAGLFGLFGGLWLQWYCNAFDYAILVSGKPAWSLPANIPIIFECTVLCSALTAFAAMFALNKLPLLYNPLFKSDRFRRVTSDRFFIVIDAADPKFNVETTPAWLASLGAAAVERIED